MTISLNSLAFDELDAVQLAYAAYLFADHLCNSDPNDYRYELNREREITGRIPLQKTINACPHKLTSHDLQLIPATHSTEAEIARVREATATLARILVARMAPITQEINTCPA